MKNVSDQTQQLVLEKLYRASKHFRPHLRKVNPEPCVSKCCQIGTIAPTVILPFTVTVPVTRRRRKATLKPNTMLTKDSNFQLMLQSVQSDAAVLCSPDSCLFKEQTGCGCLLQEVCREKHAMNPPDENRFITHCSTHH